MISVIEVGHSAGCCGLLLVALAHGDHAQECKDDIVTRSKLKEEAEHCDLSDWAAG